jgi:ectoine hydroxylase
MTTVDDATVGPTTTARPVLRPEEVEAYGRDGYLVVPSFLDRFPGEDWLARLRAASARFVERSRELTEPNAVLDLEPGHTAAQPRLRRLISPVDHDDDFASFALDGPAARLAVDLLGAPARYHHSKLNYKEGAGGAQIDWHQDIQFWPHSDFSPLTIGVYLEDVDDTMGPMGVIPGSHRGELFDLYGDDGRWTGAIKPRDLDRVEVNRAHFLTGPAGSVTVHNACAVHGSVPNDSPRPRPLLLQTYSAAASYPLLGVGTNGRCGPRSGTLVGGGPPRWLTIDGRRLPAAPNWSRGGYTTIFDAQDR